MAKEKPVEITVTTVFSGKQDSKQAFIDLLLLKHREGEGNKNLDAIRHNSYNRDKVFSDVRVV